MEIKWGAAVQKETKPSSVAAIGRLIGAVAMMLALASCVTSFEQGWNAAQQGNYDEAYEWWLPSARAGDALSQHYIARIWEKGYGSRPVNLEQAKYWYSQAANQGSVASMISLGELYEKQGDTDSAFAYFYEAARWGDLRARASLRRLNAPVPEPDLMRRMEYEQAVREARSAEALIGLAESIGCYVGGGTCGSSTSTAASASTASRQSIPTQVVSGPRSCRAATDCPNFMTYRCVKAPLQFEGVCLRNVNEFGNQQFQTPRASDYNISIQPECRFSTQCPVGFRCDPELKACVR